MVAPAVEVTELFELDIVVQPPFQKALPQPNVHEDMIPRLENNQDVVGNEALIGNFLAPTFETQSIFTVASYPACWTMVSTTMYKLRSARRRMKSMPVSSLSDMI